MQSSLRCARCRRARVAAVGVLWLSGCALGHRSFVPDQDADQFDDVAFLHYLPTVPVVTVAEGSRAVLLVVGSTDNWPSHEARWQELGRRGAVKSAWGLDPEHILDKGTLAHMLCVLCDVPRSFSQALASSTGLGDRRYALRTCVYEGLLPYARAQDPVSGGELLSALQTAEACEKSLTANRG